MFTTSLQGRWEREYVTWGWHITDPNNTEILLAGKDEREECYWVGNWCTPTALSSDPPTTHTIASSGDLGGGKRHGDCIKPLGGIFQTSVLTPSTPKLPQCPLRCGLQALWPIHWITDMRNARRPSDVPGLAWSLKFKGEGWGEGIVREFGIDMYVPLCLKWITSKDLLYSTENSAQCYVIT